MSEPPGAHAGAEPAALGEPVRRYLAHAIDDHATRATTVLLTMRGRIRVRRWLSFRARQTISGHDFEWRARAGVGPLRPLTVVDAYRSGRGSTDGRLGPLRFLHEDDADTARAAAVRSAVEAIWLPTMLLPRAGVAWRAESAERIVATMSVAPERPEVAIRIDRSGAPLEVSAARWGNVGQPAFGYIPFGGLLSGERRFGPFVIPCEVRVGWWFGTPRFEPFFEATVTDAVFGR